MLSVSRNFTNYNGHVTRFCQLLYHIGQSWTIYNNHDRTVMDTMEKNTWAKIRNQFDEPWKNIMSMMMIMMKWIVPTMVLGKTIVVSHFQRGKHCPFKEIRGILRMICCQVNLNFNQIEELWGWKSDLCESKKRLLVTSLQIWLVVTGTMEFD